VSGYHLAGWTAFFVAVNTARQSSLETAQRCHVLRVASGSVRIPLIEAMTRKFNPENPGDLRGRDLFDRALSEVNELGSEPDSNHEGHWLWGEEHRGAVELLAGLSGWDSANLRRAVLHFAHDERRRCAVDDRLCGRESVCALDVAWGRAADELTASLRTTTVADLTAAVPG
jgi:hypothetical protein